MTMFRAMGSMFFVIGFGLLLGCGALTWKADQFIRMSERAPGLVTAFHRSNDGYSSPVVRFRTAEGREIMFTSKWRSRPADYDVGEQVEVLYPPARPGDASIGSMWEQRGVSIILGAIGGTFMLFGVAGIVFGRMPKPPSPAEAHSVPSGAPAD